jgi:hypothetical protein
MQEKNCPFDVSPYEQSGRIKTPTLINVNYTNQDFWSMKARLVDFIKERFTNDFNDFVESQIAIMLIENWAFIADTLSFKIDQIANEIFIDTVSEVDNAFRLALLVGFKPLPPIASRSKWSAELNSLLPTDMVVPTPVIIDINTEEGPKVIELFQADSDFQPLFNEDIVISSGNFLNNNIIGLEGKTHVQTFVGDGSTNQFLYLSFGPVIWGSVRVTVDGNQWEEVNYFTDSQPRNEFRVEYDPNYNGFIIFGNNTAGQIPAPGSQIVITYRTGGGVAGDIVTGSVNLQRNYIVPGFDFRVPLTFRNYTKGEFGYDGDTIEDIKRKLPPYLRTQNRLVSNDDFDTIINQFSTQFSGSIGKGTAIVRQYGCAANVVDVYILAKSGINGLTEAGNELKIALENELNKKKMLTTQICIKDGEIIETDIAIDVIMDKFYKKFEDEFQVKINRRINNFFSLNNWAYGKSLKSTDIIKNLSDIDQIKSTEITLITNDVTNSGDLVSSKYYQIIRPNNIEINFVYE